MINTAQITSALESLLKNDATLAKTAKKIERAGYVNKAHDNMPWVGVYRGSVGVKPGAMGVHARSWGAEVSLVIILQVYNFKDARLAEEQLDSLIEAVQDAIWADYTIGGTVEMITGFDIEYSYKESDSKTVFEQWASLTIRAEVATG